MFWSCIRCLAEHTFLGVQGVVLAATFAVSHNVAEAKPLASGSATTSSLLADYQERDWGVQQVCPAPPPTQPQRYTLHMLPVQTASGCEAHVKAMATVHTGCAMPALVPLLHVSMSLLAFMLIAFTCAAFNCCLSYCSGNVYRSQQTCSL